MDKARRSKPLYPLVLIGPLLAIYAIWYLAPLVTTMLNSFHPFEPKGIRYDQWTLDNYTHILGDSYYLSIMLRTLTIAVLVALASAAVVFPVALFMDRQSPSVQTYLMLIYITPWLVNVTVKAFGWSLLLGPGGIINSSLRATGLISSPLKLMFNEFGVFIGLFHAQFIFVLLPVWAALQRLNRDMLHAARSLGASSTSVVWRIIVPLTLPALVAGLIINMTMSISAFTTPALLGGVRVKLMSYVSYEINLLQLNWPLGAAMGAILIAVTFIPVLMLRGIGRPKAWRG